MTRSSYTARWSWRLAATVLAVTGAWGCYVSLPTSAFQTQSVLALDGPVALRAAMARVASDAIVSKPIITRAASLLVASDIVTPQPGFAERVGVVIGTGTATSRQARIADTITAMVRATPGSVPGTVEITARAPEADQAARVADAMSDAFLSQQDEAIAQVRARREARVATRIETARADVQAARQRLASLGGSLVDPAEAKATAAARTAAAEARLASIRAIVASGSPPISDRKDLPPVLAAPQTAYLDLKAQLAKESETLGERHTTIIALQDAVKRAAATLSGEWNRLMKIAAADVASARAQEAALRTAGSPADATQRAVLDEARRAVQVAEEGLARAQKQIADADDPSFRTVGRAPVPNVTFGFPMVVRAAASALAALLMLLIVWCVSAFVPRRSTTVSKPVAKAARATGRSNEPVPVAAGKETRSLDISDHRARTEPVARPRTRVGAEKAIARRLSPPLAEPVRSSRRAAVSHATSVPRHVDLGREDLTNRDLLRDLLEDDSMTDDLPTDNLMEAMHAIVIEIETLHDALPTVMIAANEAGAGTTKVALALGQAAAEANLRVLLIETARLRPDLAASVDAQADPVLIDLYGSLRIGVPAETGDGFLTLAPIFRDAERLASGLARNRTTALIDDVSQAFDLILIDADVASDAVAAGWTADAFVRVGTSASARDDMRFCGTLDATPNALLATILSSDIEAEPVAVETREPAPVQATMPVPRVSRAGAARSLRRAPVVATSASPRRKVAGRP